ncbi:MAG: DNA polymerase III subunit beta [Desulfuromonadales bacterium]|nr:DNA polymerase III subunit beta [Desulfuromonadales bacterium]
MQFTIEKEVFLRGLARVQGIVEKRTTIPILSNVLLEAVDGELFLTATDLEVGMKSSYPAEVKTAGKITVSAKKLYEIIKELPEREVSFKSRENCWIEIRCGKALFNIVGLSPEEFPYFPSPDKEQFIVVSASSLKEMIEKTAFSMSTDESKYNLNGIYFKAINEGGLSLLRLVATDGHRLALIQKPLTASHSAELQKGVIFPRKGIFELKKMTEEGEGDLLLGFLDNNAVVVRDRTIMVMRLVDGDFPDYNRVIPYANEHTAHIPRDPFFHALRRMSILSSEKSRGVKMVLKPSLLELSSSNPELGDAREDMEIVYQGPEISIGFNARYLIDILQVHDEAKVRFLIRDNMSPGLVRSEHGEDFLAVVMPMRL